MQKEQRRFQIFFHLGRQWFGVSKEKNCASSGNERNTLRSTVKRKETTEFCFKHFSPIMAVLLQTHNLLDGLPKTHINSPSTGLKGLSSVLLFFQGSKARTPPPFATELLWCNMMCVPVWKSNAHILSEMIFTTLL